MRKRNLHKEGASVGKTWLIHFILFLLIISTGLSGCQFFDDVTEEDQDKEDQARLISVPQGFKVEKVTDRLNRPTATTWDDEGNMYIALAGNDFLPERDTPMRILQIKKDGSRVEVADLSREGIKPAIVGLVWHDGWFYFTHRAEDATGAVSRVNKNGQYELLFKGIIDNQAEHQINDIQVGPDGMMYVSVGPAGNAAVLGPDVAPFVKRNPEVQARPCQDIVLVGKNYKSPNFLTEEEGDSVLTGAYVPFGVKTEPGQVIKGVSLCGGSILKFDPHNAMGTITTHAWGFRNLIGLTWDKRGNMYAAENGYDVRGLRPVNDVIDASLRIHEGKWYGVPDFSAGREPLTMEKFEVPDSLQPMMFIGNEPMGKDLGFVIDHEKSGLTAPDPSVVLGRHEVNSSPSMLDVAPLSWGPWAGHVFIAEWGDLAPPTNPLRGERPAIGFRIVEVDPATGNLTQFAANFGGGPASYQGMRGKGLERPFEVKFGPDGAMYIVDYGVVEIDMSQAPPYKYKENTGVIWKVSSKINLKK
jgi:glucose/arabinose dehydrogenase